MRKDQALARATHATRSAAAAVRAVERALSGDFTKAVSLLKKRQGTILVAGIGKSSFIAMKVAATLTSLGRRAVFIHPVEAMHGDIGILGPADVLLAFSFSGKTAELVRLCRYVRREFHTPVISFTGNSASPLAGVSDAAVALLVKEEGSPHSLAPMASTTAMLVAGDALAAALTMPDMAQKMQFSRFHPGGSLGLELTAVKDRMLPLKKIPVVQTTDPLRLALKIITAKKAGIAAVCEGRTLRGSITDGDIRRLVLKGNITPATTARATMTSRPKTIGSDASLKEALALMEHYKITALFVVDKKNNLTGLLSLHLIAETF